MIISSIQKLTLLDYPGHLACTVFLPGCNFRCPFCHNSALIASPNGGQPAVTEDELLSFLKKRRGLLDGVCITGGEPTLQRGLNELLSKIKALGYLVKLDTNGTAPDTVRDLVSAGLIDYVAMDIKNSREKYALTSGMDSLDIAGVERTAQYLLGNHVDYEFRTTVVRELHDEDDMAAIGKWLRGAKRYYLQSFVDSGAVVTPGLHAHDEQTMKHFCSRLGEYVPSVDIRGI